MRRTHAGTAVVAVPALFRGEAGYIRSKTPAAPIPPPMHIVTMP